MKTAKNNYGNSITNCRFMSCTSSQAILYSSLGREYLYEYHFVLIGGENHKPSFWQNIKMKWHLIKINSNSAYVLPLYKQLV